MDAVILAAGKNERLQEIIPAYHKPLLVINGETLIGRLVRQAFMLCDTVTIVASSQNVQAIQDIAEKNSVKGKLSIVIQPKDTQAPYALKEGLKMVKQSHVMLMCGDNYILDEDWEKFSWAYKKSPTNLISVIKGKDNDLHRFSRLDDSLSCIFLDKCVWTDGYIRAWVGPIVIDGARTLEAVDINLYKEYTTFSGFLLPQNGYKFDPIELNVQDIGVPEALT